MKTFNQLKTLIDNEIENISLPVEPQNFYTPVKYILSFGGKRIRPVFTLMACDMFNGDVNAALKPALGLEIFHNFTLLHDDIMDHSLLRRGKPTVNTKWNDNIAILSGDGMAFIATKYLFGAPQNVAKEVVDIYLQTALEVCEGQQYDMDFEQRDDVAEAEYIEMIRLKTAVLPAACLKIGALIGGASEQQADKLYQVGINIGLAFQLQDDMLDVYSDEKTLGKPIGGDIEENKKTFMLISAINKHEDKKQFLDILNNKQLTRKQKYDIVRNIYDQLKIRQLAHEKIDYYFNNAYNILETVNADTSQLKLFVDKIYKREK